MCAFAVPPTTLLGAGADATLVAARGMLHFAADTMRSVVSGWEDHESQLAAELDGISTTGSPQ
jgi:hypothetical protein